MINNIEKHELYMKKAIQLALKAKGNTSPNPLVGALIVKNNRIIGKGYHKGPGKSHAEIEALKNLKGDIKNASMYITLEPCNFYGRTPPCVITIEKLPLKEIIIGMKDPNPRVNGKSIARLKRKGFNVITNVLANEIKNMNKFYEYYIRHKRTFFYMKIAQTINGYIGKDNKRINITNKKSLKFVHTMRYDFDAILVGANTINIDNPQLDTRYIRKTYKPKIIILDFHNILNYRKDIFKDKERKKIIFVNKKYKNILKHREDIKYIFIKNKNDVWDIIKYDFSNKNIISVFIEGGSKVFTNALKNSIINKLGIFTAPLFFDRGIRGISINKNNMKLIMQKNFENDIFTEYECLQD